MKSKSNETPSKEHRQYNIIGKFLCSDCGTNCGVLDVQVKLLRENSMEFETYEIFLCPECFAKRGRNEKDNT